MMPEISLNILDIAQNSIKAKAKCILIKIEENQIQNTLTVVIEDDGCGMDKEQVSKVCDPFFTSRTTRKVGLGVPFFKMAAELTGGDFTIDSTVGKGTIVKAVFILNNIDRMPIGDINETIISLISLNRDVDFIFERHFNEKFFIIKTQQFKEILGDIPLSSPEIITFIRDYLAENTRELF